MCFTEHFWASASEKNSLYIRLLRKFPPGEFPFGNFPPIKLPPGKYPRKIPTQKIPTWNIPSHFINTMFPSYQIARAPFQFSYRIGLLFPLEHNFFGMIFVTERGWNAPILKVIRGVSDSYRSAPKT